MEATGSLSFAGRAVFADGTPVAQASILFYPREGGPRPRTFRSDPDGRFASTLLGPGAASGTAWIVEDGAGWIDKGRLAPHRWYTAVGPFSLGDAELQWVFDNRGRIQVRVDPTGGPMPDGGFRLACLFWPLETLMPRDLDEQTIAVAAIPGDGGAATFDALAPGRYELRLADPKGPRDEYWSTWVTLPGEDGGMESDVLIAPYGKDFGGLRGRVSSAGGTDAPTGLRAHVTIPNRSSMTVGVRDGVLAAGALPVGKVELSIWAQGYEPIRQSVDIRGGEVTDLGDIRLVSVDDTHGWVTGHVRFEDGTPALGAMVDGKLIGTRVGPDGSFRTQLAAGTTVLRVTLGSTPLWPRAALPGTLNMVGDGDASPWNLAKEWRDTASVPVEVVPGQEAAREIVIDRSALGSVRAQWPGAPGNAFRLTLAVAHNGQVFTCAFAPPVGSRRAATDPGEVTLDKVPSGDRLLTLTIWRGAGATRELVYGGYQHDESAARDTVFTFDPGTAGALAGTMRRANGGPAPDEQVVLLAEPLSASIRRRGSVASAPVQADGTFRFPCIAPGRYLVGRAGRDEGVSQAVEIRQGAEVKVELSAP